MNGRKKVGAQRVALPSRPRDERAPQAHPQRVPLWLLETWLDDRPSRLPPRPALYLQAPDAEEEPR